MPNTLPKTFAEKALARAAGLSYAQSGQIVQVRPDFVLSHDNTAAISRIFYDELGATTLAHPDRVGIILDHASPPPTPQHAENHATIRAFVKCHNISHFFDIGRGICHQVLSEEALILPGQLILGADSHTTHLGWMGAFAGGVGRSEMAALWATGTLWLRVPESMRFWLTGELPPGTTTKDLCLTIIGTLGADDGLYQSIEFAGPALDTLSLESRMVIPNMMAELGAKNAYLPPNRAVFAYLDARGHPESRQTALYPDEGAAYTAEYKLDLSQVQPMLSRPHTVDRTEPLSQLLGRPVDMALIGTCTNGRYEDLAAAAEVVRGRRVDPSTRLIVVPASSEVLRKAIETGVLADLVEAGAIVGSPGCGPCLGNHMGVPGPGETVISSANRNFKGRMGQPEAEIYLASPAVAAASALHGEIAGPGGMASTPAGEGAIPLNAPLTPLSPPSPHTSTTPHSSPASTPFPSSAPAPSPSAQATVWKYGDHVNTDLLFPGKYTYTLKTEAEIAAHALEDLDSDFAKHVRPGDVVMGGRNFGCGSSREQAVTCLVYNQVSAVIVDSFARIFYRNAINRGLPAIICPEAVAAAQPGDRVKLDLARGMVELPAGAFHFDPFPPHIQAILDAGGLMPALREESQR